MSDDQPLAHPRCPLCSWPTTDCICDSEIDDLIEASSLGTPTARAFRDSVSDEDVDRIMDRVNEIDDAKFRRAPKRESYGDGPIEPHAARVKYRRGKHHRK